MCLLQNLWAVNTLFFGRLGDKDSNSPPTRERVSFSLLTWTFIKFFNGSQPAKLSRWNVKISNKFQSDYVSKNQPASNGIYDDDHWVEIKWKKCNQWVEQASREWRLLRFVVRLRCRRPESCDSFAFSAHINSLALPSEHFAKSYMEWKRYSRNIKKPPTITTKSSMRMKFERVRGDGIKINSQDFFSRWTFCLLLASSLVLSTQTQSHKLWLADLIYLFTETNFFIIIILTLKSAARKRFFFCIYKI